MSTAYENVWKYMKKAVSDDGTHVSKCSTCSQEFSFNSSKSTLRNYLYKDGFFWANNNQKRMPLEGSVVDNTHSPAEGRQKRFELDLSRWLVSSKSSLATVEQTDFSKMMNGLNSDIIVPNRLTMKNRIISMKDEKRLQRCIPLLLRLLEKLFSRRTPPGRLSSTENIWL